MRNAPVPPPRLPLLCCDVALVEKFTFLRFVLTTSPLPRFASFRPCRVALLPVRFLSQRRAPCFTRVHDGLGQGGEGSVLREWEDDTVWVASQPGNRL